MKQPIDIPFQIEAIIRQMLDKNENVYIRGNFRTRLEGIREAINQSIKKYDNELLVTNTTGSKKKKYKY